MTDPVAQVPVAIQMSSAFEGRSVNEYLSRDSAPPLFTTPVPLYLAPVCLVLFSALVMALLWLVNVYPPTAQVFPYDTLIVAPAEGEHTVPVRIFIISFMLAFSLTAALEWRTKILMGLDMAVTFASFCVLIDIILTIFDLLIDYRLPLRAIELFSGLVGFALYTIKLLEWGHMPAPVSATVTSRFRSSGATSRLCASTGCARRQNSSARSLIAGPPDRAGTGPRPGGACVRRRSAPEDSRPARPKAAPASGRWPP